MEEEQERDVKDLLVKLGVDMCWVKKTLANHLKHHWMVQLVLLTFIGGLIIALVKS